jgi:hypothetical protein
MLYNLDFHQLRYSWQPKLGRASNATRSLESWVHAMLLEA